MIRKLSILFAGALAGAAAVTVVGQNAGVANAAGSDTYRQLAIFGDVFERVRAQYVEEPDDQKLIETAINGMLTSLDPHSSYMNAKEAQDMRTQTRGQFGGLGIQVTMKDEVVLVEGSPFADSPAEKAGILSGDLIVEIDGDPVRGLTLSEAVEKMKGEIGTDVKLTVVREGAEKPIRMSLTRDLITVKSVKFEEIGDVGYIKVNSFNEQTTVGLEEGIEEIKAKLGDKLKGFVLDLRSNPGGLLDEAVSVSDAFLDKGEIVSTRGRNADETRRYNARQGDEIAGEPLVVLINGGSASASEIVAGALQDQRRATVVGSRSFGKGSVQTIIPLGSAGAMRLTTALYYTPSGSSIQGRGIDPDIVVDQPLPDEIKAQMGLDPEEEVSRGESSLRGHITGAEETDEGSGSSSYVPPERDKDLQLQYALDLLNGVKTNAMFPPKQEAKAAAN
ncbi:carboxyl-terminal processing protease [Fulvimarina manganoxydans]|uniref:Carboxyl-terminal processing protease n=1 Tax=Fulvimarina manganoxydans TaxID=937218 RepID=A0A1W2DDD8_9HYPH|nr:S41 family peptidase [Fulvimarina manganoxydans]MEE2951420.1 S41 family peptidase [Pseudomonadota bacterium]SMC95423.1 carboxyl-terminal processing protease [Fulvimarina manganoxydans]